MKFLEANGLEDTMLIVLAGNRRASADEPLHLRGLREDLAEPFHLKDEKLRSSTVTASLDSFFHHPPPAPWLVLLKIYS